MCCKSEYCWSRPADAMEKKGVSFPRRNWAIAAFMRGLVYVSYSITIPSMHQYITTPSADQLAATNDTLREGFYPGFGRSELFYTWAVMMYSAGEFFGALAVPFLAKFLSRKSTFLIGILTSTVGFIIYSLAPSAWFVLIARLSLGANCGISIPLIPSYLSETSVEVSQIQKRLKRQENGSDLKFNSEKEQVSQENSLKDKLFTVFTFFGSGSNIVVLGLSSLIVLIPGIHPYRWMGWLVVAGSSVLAISHLIFFKEHKPFKRQKCGSLFPNFKKISLKKKGSRQSSRLPVSSTAVVNKSGIVCESVS